MCNIIKEFNTKNVYPTIQLCAGITIIVYACSVHRFTTMNNSSRTILCGITHLELDRLEESFFRSPVRFFRSFWRFFVSRHIR